MKAYIIKIELEESDPLIWRRVIMPADATYKRLHDIIQNVSNFRGGYPYGNRHLYQFILSKENMSVTNDEETCYEHKHFIKNKDLFDQRLEQMSGIEHDFEKMHQERLGVEARYPSGLKIDHYLETYKEIEYNYDYGDGWVFKIKLEKIVDDYCYGFATLLDGAESAPPEDIGGLRGFSKFIEAYRDPEDSIHEQIAAYGNVFHFNEYDPSLINKDLKAIVYKKTETDKIIEDKYRNE